MAISAHRKTLATDEQVHSVKAVEFHRQMIRLGAESITRFKRGQEIRHYYKDSKWDVQNVNYY